MAPDAFLLAGTEASTCAVRISSSRRNSEASGGVHGCVSALPYRRSRQRLPSLARDATGPRPMIRTLLPALALAAFAPSVALADQVITVPPFRSIELHGGGNATLRRGDRQRVVLIKGDPAIAEIRVTDDGKLMLSPCRNTCWGNHEL